MAEEKKDTETATELVSETGQAILASESNLAAATDGVVDSPDQASSSGDHDPVPDTLIEPSNSEPSNSEPSASETESSSESESPAATGSEPATESEPVESSVVDSQVISGPVTAVSLGLLPEVFVSRVSTQLHFHAPDLTPRPATDSSDGSARRQRQQRTGGEETEPRVRQVEYITEPKAIKGSTRLEAKKQRRRDGRDAGRRRPVVTEAEFLARREAVDRTMVVRSKDSKTQIAVLEDGILVEHYVARNQDASLIGNVYLGRVQNVLPSMEAAFVDIGRGRNAVLYSGEVDWDGVDTGNQPRRIEMALKPGDRVLVQVTKDPVGHKGARLTSQISLPGRYLVYVPGGAMNGISRKLPDTERQRLKRILKEVLPESSGVIVRTAAEGATEAQLTHDVQRLTAQWEHIQRQVGSAQAPALLHAEPDLLVKIVRDVFNEDFHRMQIQGSDALETIRSYLSGVAPDLLERVEAYAGSGDPFDDLRISEQIDKALERKVWLPSGGSLVIDRTEAMTVVDVNTGKFVGSGGNLEETVTKNNLESAEEIVRQLRLRDIGGIIVIDFIDMVLESNRDLVLRRLIECLSRDRTKHQVAEITSLGLVQMTRKKLGLGLLETFSEPCEVCAGRGVVIRHDPIVKHRSGSSASSRRTRSASPAPAVAPAPVGNGTHSITQGAKSALAQIAASTIPGSSETSDSVDSSSEAPAGQGATEVSSNQANPSGGRQDSPPEALDDSSDRAKKPRKKREPQQKRTAPKSPTEQLLESVLDALPEPKAPGQGRTHRRASTSNAALKKSEAAAGSMPLVLGAFSETESRTVPAEGSKIATSGQTDGSTD